MDVRKVWLTQSGPGILPERIPPKEENEEDSRSWRNVKNMEAAVVSRGVLQRMGVLTEAGDREAANRMKICAYV